MSIGPANSLNSADQILDLEQIDVSDVSAEEKELDFKTILTRAWEEKSRLEKEVKSLRRAAGASEEGSEITPFASQKELDAFMKASFSNLVQASEAARELENPAHSKTSDESQVLINNLVIEQDRFFLNMKIAQIHQIQFVINGCQAIEQSPADAPQHIAAVRSNLNRLEAMPPLEELEARTSAIGKLTSLHTLTSSFSRSLSDVDEVAVSGIETENVASRAIAGGISQASRESLRPFNGLFKKMPEVRGQEMKGQEMRGISTDSNPEMLEDLVHEAAFTGLLTKYFQESFIIAKAVNDGKVLAGDNLTDTVLGDLQTAVSYIPAPMIQQGASALLSVAQYANTAQKQAMNRNVTDFAVVSGAETLQAEKLREQIVHNIAKKVYQSYSVRTDGASPLDSLTEQGMQKFAGAIVEQVITQIGSFKLPEPGDIPRFGKEDQEWFRKDAEFRREISEKYGVKFDEKKLDSDRYFSEIVEKIESKMYVEFISDRLIGSVIQGREVGTVSSKVTELGSKVRFEREDLTDPNQSKNFTFQGMVKRVGVVTADGNCYVSQDRVEDIKNEKSKYGFRAATLQEEGALSKGETMVGYVKLNRKKTVEAVAVVEAPVPVTPLLAALNQDSANEVRESEAAIKIRASESANADRTIERVVEVARQQVGRYVDSFSAGQQSKEKQNDKERDALEAKLKAAEKALANKQNPPFWKKALTVITFGYYSGGKPQKAEAEANKVKSLREALDQNEGRSVGLQQQSETMNGLRQDFEVAIKSSDKKSEASLEAVTSSVRAIANAVELSSEVAQAVQEKVRAQEKAAAQKSNFTGLIAKSFNESFVIAGALRDGKVGAQDDNVDVALGAAKSAVGLIPLPLVQQGAAVLLAIGTQINSAKKDAAAQNVAGFAEAGDSDKDLRQQIIQNIAEKLHAYYSVKTEGKSPLDNLTEKGMGKFAGALVEQIITQIAGLNLAEQEKPEQEKSSKDKFISDVADRLIGPVIHGQEAVNISGVSGKKAELGSAIRFNEVEDLTEAAKGKKFTIQGLMKRVGIVTSGGQRFNSQDRAADAESKYGFRAATAQEEESLRSREVIAGYVKTGQKEANVSEKEAAAAVSAVAGLSVKGGGSGVSDPFAKIDSTPARSPEELAALAKFAEVAVVDHISSKVKTLEKTDVISAVGTSVVNMVGVASETLSGFVASSAKTQQAMPEVQQRPTEYEAKKSELVAKINLSQLAEAPPATANSATAVSNALVDFVQCYHAQVMAGASTADLRKFAADNLPVRKDNQELVKEVVGLAVSYSEAGLEKLFERKAASEAAAILPVAPEIVAIRREAALVAAPIPQAPISKAQNISARDGLLLDFQEMVTKMGSGNAAMGMGFFKAEVAAMKGGKIEGNKITMPGLVVESEGKRSVCLVLEVDPRTHKISGIELQGGDSKGVKALTGNNSRELFDDKGAMKESHAEAMKLLLQSYSKDLGLQKEETLGSEALKAERFAKNQTPSSTIKTASLFAVKLADLGKQMMGSAQKAASGMARQ